MEAATGRELSTSAAARGGAGDQNARASALTATVANLRRGTVVDWLARAESYTGKPDNAESSE
jgi:hypothetical protein